MTQREWGDAIRKSLRLTARVIRPTVAVWTELIRAFCGFRVKIMSVPVGHKTKSGAMRKIIRTDQINSEN